jgi:hypothetical protein
MRWFVMLHGAGTLRAAPAPSPGLLVAPLGKPGLDIGGHPAVFTPRILRGACPALLASTAWLVP